MKKYFLLLSFLITYTLFSQSYRISIPREVSTTNERFTSPPAQQTEQTNSSSGNTMSDEEKKEFGLTHLNEKQWQGLNDWYSKQQGSAPSKDNATNKNAVSMVLSEGHYVKLGSGEVWNINPSAWIYTYYWQKGDPVKVSKSKDTLFPMQLTNENSGQSVTAQKASSDAQQAFSKNYTIQKIINDGQFLELSDGSIWQIEPSARYMVQGWSVGEPIFTVKMKNATGTPFELYNGQTTRSVFATQTKAPVETASKSKNPSKSSTQPSENAPNSTSTKPQS